MSSYAGAEKFGDRVRVTVTPVEPVDDPQYLRNLTVPDREFSAATPEEAKPKVTPRFVGAACQDNL
jgi:hypothetical protein